MTAPTFRYTEVSAPAPCTAGVLQASAPIEPSEWFTTAVAELFDDLSDRPAALVTWQIEDANDEQADLEGIRALDVRAPDGTEISPIYGVYAATPAALASALRAAWHLAPEVFPLDDPDGIESVRGYYEDLLGVFEGRGVHSGDAETDTAAALVDAALDVLTAQANLGAWPHDLLTGWVGRGGAHMQISGYDGYVVDCRIVTTRADLEDRCRAGFAAAGIELT